MAAPVYNHISYRKAKAAAKVYGGPCAICGLPGATSVDHVRPVASFPKETPLAIINDSANLRPTHASCNYRRGAKYGNARRNGGGRLERSPLVD